MGPQGPIGATGPQGPQGIQGLDGVPGILVGWFGVTREPVELPQNGFMPAHWDQVGNPAADYQMQYGQMLHYDPPNNTLPNAGHVYSFVTDQLDPSGWRDVGRFSMPAPPGPGPEEVFVDPNDPYVLDPLSTVELWYDTNAVTVVTAAESASLKAQVDRLSRDLRELRKFVADNCGKGGK
jgi:hypothetical protein